MRDNMFKDPDIERDAGWEVYKADVCRFTRSPLKDRLKGRVKNGGRADQRQDRRAG